MIIPGQLPSNRICLFICQHARSYRTSRSRLLIDDAQQHASDRVEVIPQASSVPSAKTTHHMRIKANQKDFVIDVLGASTTRRDAKSYLSRFQSDAKRVEFKQQPTEVKPHAGNAVNLGTLFQTPLVEQLLNPFSHNIVSTETRHVALVLIRAPDAISDEVLHGVTRTLSQLSQLGMHCIVMLDLPDDESLAMPRMSPTESGDTQIAQMRQLNLAQADRVVDAFETHLDQRARRLEYLFHIRGHTLSSSFDLHQGCVEPELENMHLLEQCLNSGAIPVILPIVRDKDMRVFPLHAQAAMTALSRELTVTAKLPPGRQETMQEKISHVVPGFSSSYYSVDRVVVLDSIGGIPAGPIFDTSHVFINLEQEYEIIRQDLVGLANVIPDQASQRTIPSQSSAALHLSNLSLVKRALKFLPASASALITSPEAVARYEYSSTRPEMSDVGTRSQRNLLIHNILTDKPIRSSSLPSSRFAGVSDGTVADATKLSATFLKHGMPITILPDPKIQTWQAPTRNIQMLSLQDPRLDIERLVHLIEDSFGRPLDREHYFSRIAPLLAGIIVAGDYEGCAILTWEKPPSITEENSPRFVPYLDKFAVLKRSQGAGGVADVVFSAMVRDCFPQGVCWRSRSNNPVNKWYFERARGTYKLAPEDGENPSAQSWTMFWTTEGIHGQRFHDYEEVCRSIESSWADGKQKLD